MIFKVMVFNVSVIATKIKKLQQNSGAINEFTLPITRAFYAIYWHSFARRGVNKIVIA